MSLQDYTTRKYDILGFQAIDGNTNGQMGMALYAEDNQGRICTGIQKLAQRWALEFLTELGSMPYQPDRGCAFMARMRQGRLLSQVDVIAAFHDAALTIQRNLQLEEYTDMPVDERYADVDLVSVSLFTGYIDLRVMIVSQAGDSRVVVLPVATLP